MKKLMRLSAVIICVLAVVVTATAAYAARTGLDGYCHNQDCPYYGGECRNESCGYYCGTPADNGSGNGNGNHHGNGGHHQYGHH